MTQEVGVSNGVNTINCKQPYSTTGRSSTNALGLSRKGKMNNSSSSSSSGSPAAPAVDSSAGSAGLNVDSGATKRKHLKGRRSLMIGSGNPTGGITTGVGLNI